MANPLIKICGLRDPSLAHEAAKAGANFIGLVFHPNSKRYVSIDEAKLIAAATKKGGAIPVAVFANQSALEMQEICIATDIQTIQLHGDKARNEHHLLSKEYMRIYVKSVSPDGIINEDKSLGLTYCDTKKDLLMFDNIEAGKGQPFNWNKFQYNGDFPFCLAGGLTVNNVNIAIKKLQPYLVDVSGGVENSSGEKDILMIQEFINSAKSAKSACFHPQ